MKIITMEQIVQDGEPIEYDDFEEVGEDHRDWFCVIETLEEEMVYDKAFHEPFNPASATKSLVQGTYLDLWNDMVKHAGREEGLGWGDDDIYAYIMPNETMLKVGDHYKLDDDEWVRVA